MTLEVVVGTEYVGYPIELLEELDGTYVGYPVELFEAE